MKHVMDYESIDWEAEAKRVARAFGVSEDCYFEEHFNDVPAQTGHGNNHLLCFLDGDDSCRLPAYNGVVFWCYYDKEKWSYFFERTAEQQQEGVRMYSNGSLGVSSVDGEFYPLLVKGLFYLGFLEDGAEEIFGLQLSAHEKLEWAREYAERYGL